MLLSVLVILGVRSHEHTSTHAKTFQGVLSITCAVPCFELLFFLSFVSFNILFIFSNVIFNFFCVGYIDGIPGGILTLYFVSTRPGFHFSLIPLLRYCMSLFSFPILFVFSRTHYPGPLCFGQNDKVVVSITPYLSVLISFARALFETEFE